MARNLAERIGILEQLTQATQERVTAELTEQATRLVDKSGSRLRLGEQTVVALAGATGSGKSSLFNAIAEAQLAEQGTRRPTTSQTLALSFGPSNPELLDWLDIKRRNEVPAKDERLTNLILLDLPDHDSTESDHRDEVDRLVKVVDQFVWVVDPQKYADAAIHERYLRPLAEHRDVITVVLNQSDRLPPQQLAACLRDLRTLLDDDGLADVPLLATSALTGQGVAELRDRLANLAQRKSAAAARLTADLAGMAQEFDDQTAGGQVGSASEASVSALTESLSLAAGVPTVTDAVAKAMVRRGSLATGWPLVKWLAGLKPDPLKRLRIGQSRNNKQLPGSVPERTSLPRRGDVAASRLKTGLRQLSIELGEGMPTAWRQGVDDAIHSNEHSLPDTLDRAIVATDLGTERVPIWWQLLRVLQWLLILTGAVGLIWLLASFILIYVGMPPLPSVPIGFTDGPQFPLPAVLLVGSVLLGILLSLVARIFVGLGARSLQRRARSLLRKQMAKIGQEQVLAPAQAELERYAEVRSLVAKLGN